jgi:asparagine synthase (glutamine-hydrolysing)
VKKALTLAVKALPAGAPRSRRERIRRYCDDAMTETRRRYARWVSIVPPAVKAELYSPAFRHATASVDPLDVLLRAYAMADTPDLVDATLGADVGTYLPDDLLVKVDIASMAHGLEARSPLIDHDVMELAAVLPSDFKLRGRDKKHIFKRAMRGLVPDAILQRPKQGFGVPIAGWLRAPLRTMVEETLFGRAARERGLFAPSALRRLVDEHDRGVSEHHPQLWALLMLELWFARFIDAPRMSTSA